jgi:hypothetical protein
MSTNDIGRVWESYPGSKEAMEQFSLYHARDAHRVELARQAGQPDFDLFIQAPITPPDEVNPVLGRKVEAAEWMNFRQVGTNPKSPFAKSPTPKFELDQAVVYHARPDVAPFETKVEGVRVSIFAATRTHFVMEYLVRDGEMDMVWAAETELTAKEQK